MFSRIRYLPRNQYLSFRMWRAQSCFPVCTDWRIFVLRSCSGKVLRSKLEDLKPATEYILWCVFAFSSRVLEFKFISLEHILGDRFEPEFTKTHRSGFASSSDFVELSCLRN